MKNISVFQFGAVLGLHIVCAASLQITSPTSESSFHSGDEVPVMWFYEGTGEYFSILLHKDGELVADLCEAEEDESCFDLTQDQTVILPSGIASGTDYTITVKDTVSSAEGTSDTFTIIEDPYSNIEITSPNGNTAFNAGEDVQVEWLYVGENTLFDIYVRQGEGFESRRISENLCGSEREGSCRGSVVGQAVVTLPKELEDADDYTLLVVDKEDDDAYGMSPLLSVGLDIAYADTGGGFFSEKSNVVKLSLIIGGCVLGLCILVAIAVLIRMRTRTLKGQEKIAALGVTQKRRPAPTVILAVEDMQQPVSPSEGGGFRYPQWLRKSLSVNSETASRADTEESKTTNSMAEL